MGGAIARALSVSTKDIVLANKTADKAEKLAAELGITVNNLCQIKNRIKQRIADEVRAIRENSPDGD